LTKPPCASPKSWKPRIPEVTPFAFAPLNGLAGDTSIADGHATLPELAGIGFEANAAIRAVFKAKLGVP